MAVPKFEFELLPPPLKQSLIMAPPINDPVLPETEAVLRCANKRRLYRALRLAADSRWISDWLFSQPTHPFHHHTSISPDAFDNSLAIGAVHRVVAPGSPASSSSLPSARQGRSGRSDMLLVPVAYAGGKLIGYSFGGGTVAESRKFDCSFDNRVTPFIPHFVGRFAFDSDKNDLVIVVNQLSEYVTGVMSIKRSDERGRERSVFTVMNGTYGYKRLPARIAKMSTMLERRLASIPKYQFAIQTAAGGSSAASGRGRGVRTDMETMRGHLAKLERLVKGKFFGPKMFRDVMDVEIGDVTSRDTAQVESLFDVQDAVGMQRCRDVAVRAYYSYMSAVSSGDGSASASTSAAGSSSTAGSK